MDRLIDLEIWIDASSTQNNNNAPPRLLSEKQRASLYRLYELLPQADILDPLQNYGSLYLITLRYVSGEKPDGRFYMRLTAQISEAPGEAEDVTLTLELSANRKDNTCLVH